MSRRPWLLLVVPCLLPLALTPADPGRGGLSAVALRPDGKAAAAAGTGRAIYLLDPATLAVTGRLWHGARVQALAYTADGSRLLVQDDADVLSVYDVGAGKVAARVEGVRDAAFAPAAGLVAVRPVRTAAVGAVRLLAMADGAVQEVIEFRDRVGAFSLTPEGRSLLVLSLGLTGDERRFPVDETPRDLTGLARREWQQRRDGLTSRLRVVALPGGQVVRESRLWYTSDSGSTRLWTDGPDIVVANRAGECARVTPADEVTLFETGLLFNEAAAPSADGKALLAGGLRGGTVGPAGGKRVPFALTPLPGGDEAVTGFAVNKDGAALGVTTGGRAFWLAPGGAVERIAPVY